MKTIAVDLPDEVARLFEAMPREEKSKVTLLAALLFKSKPKSLEDIFKSVDQQVAASGLTEKEIEEMLNELS